MRLRKHLGDKVENGSSTENTMFDQVGSPNSHPIQKNLHSQNSIFNYLLLILPQESSSLMKVWIIFLLPDQQFIFMKESHLENIADICVTDSLKLTHFQPDSSKNNGCGSSVSQIKAIKSPN